MTTAKINTDLKRAPIDTFKEDPENARRHPDRNMTSIKASLTAFGQQKPILVDPKTNVILAGNGTWRAAKQLGWSEVGFSYYDGPAHKGRAFAIADNRTAELAEWDTAALQDDLHAMAPEEWADCGWTVDEVRNTTGSLPSSAAPTGDAGGETLSHEGQRTGLTPEDKIDTFLHNTVRQIVLIYPEADVGRALAQLEQVCKDQGLDSNTDAVDWLLAQYMAAKQE
jgi:hypothetical protein